MPLALQLNTPWGGKNTKNISVVVGLARSGMAAAKLLTTLGMHVRVLDTKKDSASAEFIDFAHEHGIEIMYGPHTQEQFVDACVIVVSPGIPLRYIQPFAKKAKAPLISEVELALPFVKAPIIAITGTSGKTTTASLMASMLRTAGKKVFLGGNIGVPLSSYVLQDEEADVLVLELSSFQLQGTHSLHPRVAVFMNCFPNHLDHHESMEEYLEAKLRIFALQTATDTAIFDSDFAIEYAHRNFQAQPVLFTTTKRFAQTRLMGEHNQQNAEIAFLACREFGVSESEAIACVKNFVPLRHRLEWVGEKNGVLFINDSKSTTVDALRIALASFTAPIFLLAGGKFKGGDLASLQPVLKEKVHHVALYGGARDIFESAWQGHVPLSWDAKLAEALHRIVRLSGINPTTDTKDSLSKTVVFTESAHPQELAQSPNPEHAPNAAQSVKSVILLSPATASYDQFKDYEERGDIFCGLARGYL